MPDARQQHSLPPLDEVAQSLARSAIHAEWVTRLQDLQSHQSHTDIQLLVVLGTQGFHGADG